MMANRLSGHEECWLLLPWVASGRLSLAQRMLVEEHVGACAACAEELARQRLMCRALTEPDRITYAPGPSFRKLMDRIDGEAAAAPRASAQAARGRSARPAGQPLGQTADANPILSGGMRPGAAAAWRPPGLAWAASFVLAVGLAAFGGTAYRWSQPLYSTHTTPRDAHEVLHIAFVRTLSIGEVEELLRAAGARVVEGPGSSGVFGVMPVDARPDGAQGGGISPEMLALAARLRADARVRWVEPLAAGAAGDNAHGQRAQER
jgi:hypothetical protein